MWCEQCQTDVATEIAADGQSLLCTTCHQPVRKIVAPSLHPETRSAREFLERWAREQRALTEGQQPGEIPAPLSQGGPTTSPVMDPSPAAASVPQDSAPSLSAVPGSAAASGTVSPAPPDAETRSEPGRSAAQKRQSKYRMDGEHAAPAGPTPSRRTRTQPSRLLEKVPAGTQPPPESPPAPIPASEPERRKRIDAEHVTAPGPHFDVRTNAPERTAFPGRAEAMWGQLLAYGGVGLLTVGTVLVLWGYFGDLERYASTGWLLSTAGQMLLLLGVVTLVGGGLQQTTHEVSQRIEHLGGRIIRIEQSTDRILKGPRFRQSRRRQRRAAAEDPDAA